MAVESCLRQLRVSMEAGECGESTTVNTDPAELDVPSAADHSAKPEVTLPRSSPRAPPGHHRMLIAILYCVLESGDKWWLR
ncbi:MAG: hypothetical protein O2820_20790 [Planctomycetota bacterium]|nr:hypothetical protein [Planctomycetota bacterium]MDA1251655.1 hypothetical protein [Planctomycetota bacterium]